jgi:hypothetical protein
MELIVLNIGLELKVLTEVFTMMVIMALVTTFMTGPALDLINYLFKSKVVPDAEEITNQSKYRILFSFGNNEREVPIAISETTKKQKSNSTVTAMHLLVMNCTLLTGTIKKRQILSYFEESEFLNIEIETILRQQLISSRRLLMWQTRRLRLVAGWFRKSILKGPFLVKLWVLQGS